MALGMTQAQLGALAGMGGSHVSEAELGYLGKPTITRLEASLDRSEQGDR